MKNIIKTFSEHGTFIQQETLDYIMSKKDPYKFASFERLRLSSLQPHHISRELTSQWQDNRLCRHFHLALQSGSDTVLRRMKRQYNKNGFEEAVEKIKDVSKAVVKQVIKTQKKETPPSPFSTTTFLQAASYLKISAPQAMKIAEELYMEGLISYPRTEASKAVSTS